MNVATQGKLESLQADYVQVQGKLWGQACNIGIVVIETAHGTKN